MRQTTLRLFAILALLGPGFFSAQVHAKASVPLNLQAALYAKILRYDKQLENKKAHILVVGQGDEGKAAVQAFSQAGFAVEMVNDEALSTKIDQCDVLYMIPSAAASAIAKLARSKKKLLISGEEEHARQGHAALSLGIKANGKPQIIVNVQAASDQGHTFSSQLLALAEIIRD